MLIKRLNERVFVFLIADAAEIRFHIQREALQNGAVAQIAEACIAHDHAWQRVGGGHDGAEIRHGVAFSKTQTKPRTHPPGYLAPLLVAPGAVRRVQMRQLWAYEMVTVEQ